MNKMNCVIVIPIHNAAPSPYELISFQQCFKILNKHSIKIIAPEGLDLKKYKKVTSFDMIFINPKWLGSLKAYNKLKISRFLYDLFPEYDFLLTYELDAFIFRDELEYWCNKGYDFIGAPWIDFRTNITGQIYGVGNSGFSLRKIKTLKKVLRKYFFKNPEDYERGNKNLIKAYFKFPYQWLRNQFKENYTIQNFCDINEDQFLCDFIPDRYKDFKLSPVKEAMQFSFEMSPRKLYSLNNNKLPMGCHAWWKYDLDFWKPHIESFGYNLNSLID